MTCNPCQTQPIQCPSDCPPNQCPDFEIKRYDTRPPFSVDVRDCDGPIDLTNVIVEVNMWANAKLKTAISPTDMFLAFADNIGFEKAMVGDIIVMNRVRSPEQMLVVGFDETNKLVQVQRGYHGSPISSYPKGCGLRIMRVLNSFGDVVMVREDVTHVDGTVETGVLQDSRVVYNWQPNDTCLPGCYWLEFKLLKMLLLDEFIDGAPAPASVIPSQSGCYLGKGVEWARRIPTEGEGFLVKIFNSPTMEGLSA